MVKFLKTLFLAFFIFTFPSGFALAVTIWNATDRAPAVGTERIPVDTSSSSSAGYLEVGDIRDFVDSNSNALVTGAAGATDNAVARFDATTGRLVQNSSVYITDTPNVGIDITPTARLHLPAGTAASNTAPLKFTDGTLMSSAEEGVIEFSDGHFYFSKIDAVRYVPVFSNGVKTTTTTVTNTTTETTIYSRAFIANELHIDEVVEFVVSGVFSNASSADDFTLRFKIDAVTVHTISRAGGNVTNAGWESKGKFTVRTDGASGTYVDYFQYMENGSSPYAAADSTTHSVDTTASHTFTITVQWANAKAGNTFYATQGYTNFMH